MSVETDTATVRRFFEEVLPAGDVDQVAALVAPDFVDHNPTPGQAAGTEGIRHVVRNLRGAHADLRITVDDLVGEGGHVAARWTLRDTHTGPLFGMPPSGESVENSTLVFFRLVDGKVVERWAVHIVSPTSRRPARSRFGPSGTPASPPAPLVGGREGTRASPLDAVIQVYVHSPLGLPRRSPLVGDGTRSSVRWRNVFYVK